MWEDMLASQLQSRHLSRSMARQHEIVKQELIKVTEIRTNSLRELHRKRTTRTNRKASRTRAMGHSRTRRVRPTSTTIISGHRSPLRLLRYRLPEFSRKCHGQSMPLPLPL